MCVVSPRGDPLGCALGIARRSETTHSGVDVNNTHPSMINPLSNYLSQCWPCSVTMYGANRTQSIKTAYWWKTGAIYIKTDNAHFLIFMWDQYILFCIAWNRRKLRSRASSRRSNPSSRRLKKNGEGGTVQPVSVLTMKYNPFSYFVSTLVSIMTWHRKDDSDLETSSLSKNCEIIQVLA